MVGWCFNYQIMVLPSTPGNHYCQSRASIYAQSSIWRRAFSIQSLALSPFLFSGLGRLFGTICLCDLGSFLVIIPISLFVWSDMNQAIIHKSITSNVVSKLNTYSHYDIILQAFKRVVIVIGDEKLSLVC